MNGFPQGYGGQHRPELPQERKPTLTPKQRLGYSLKEAAAMFGLSVDTLRRAAHACELRSFRAGRGNLGKIMVTHEALMEWVHSRETAVAR